MSLENYFKIRNLNPKLEGFSYTNKFSKKKLHRIQNMRLIKAEVVTIGDEILYGQITDTNTQFISAELDKIGIKTLRKISIGDAESEILGLLSEVIQRADVVIFTGGLGPTKDDITKKTLAKFFDDTLVKNDTAFEMVKAFFGKRGREFTELNQQQAFLPSKAVFIPNPVGTAPGMWFNANGKILVSLPGVPYEMKYLMENEIIPRLKVQFQTPIISHKVLRTAGIGESMLAELIESWEDALPPHIKLAYLPSFGQVKLRLTGVGKDLQQLENEIDNEVEKVFPLIKKYLFSTSNQNLEEVIGIELVKKESTLSVAESCTGGYLSQLITSISGCSAYFKGGIIAYSNEVKQSQLFVSEETLAQNGAVSKETIEAMAKGVREQLQTTYGIATSGVAGPAGGTEEKPVGTVWIAVATPEKVISKKLLLSNQRATNIQYSSFAALNLLRLVLAKETNESTN